MPLNTCRTLWCGWDWQELQVAETGRIYRRRSERNEKIYFEQVSALPDGPQMDGGVDACYN